MSIVLLTTDTTGQLNVNPRRVKLITTDTLATITTAGYLNPKNLQGFNIYSSDVFDVYYSWTTENPLSGTGTYEVFTCTLSATTGITLVQWSNPGDVLLPVVSGDFAVFNGTTGQIKDAGYSPSNAAKTKVVMATAATISGQLAMFTDTAGTIGDSGVLASSYQPLVTSVTLNPTQMAAAYATPATLLANPLASQMYLLLAAQVYTASTGNTAYTTGTAPIIQYSSGGTNGAHGLGTIATATGLVAGDITAATSQVRNLFQFATNAQTGLSGLGIYFSNATGGYAAGTGTNITFTLTYLLLTATV